MQRLVAAFLGVLPALSGPVGAFALACGATAPSDCCCSGEKAPGSSIAPACPCGCVVPPLPAEPPRKDPAARVEPAPAAEHAPEQVGCASPALACAPRLVPAAPVPAAESPPLFLLHRSLLL
ncbi:MAG TPA: hypothetical protein VFI25_13960 [Planctomycetota bacterium]|nr:hypothetical protein [Planctomycetota bacterium]